MSITPWWKKEISLRRRPRGTVVVAKPLIAPELVERAAAIFEPPDVFEPSIWPVEPSEPERDDVLARPPAPAPLPQVWPPALVDSTTADPAPEPRSSPSPGRGPIPNRCP